VETQVASNNQQMSQARQNALLALNIDGRPTTPGKFRFVTLPPQGIHILATP
jgi:hypothetical protein